MISAAASSPSQVSYTPQCFNPQKSHAVCCAKNESSRVRLRRRPNASRVARSVPTTSTAQHLYMYLYRRAILLDQRVDEDKDLPYFTTDRCIATSISRLPDESRRRDQISCLPCVFFTALDPYSCAAVSVSVIVRRNEYNFCLLACDLRELRFLEKKTLTMKCRKIAIRRKIALKQKLIFDAMPLKCNPPPEEYILVWLRP